MWLFILFAYCTWEGTISLYFAFVFSYICILALHRMASKPKVSQPSSGYSSKSSSAADDPFLVFESSRSEENTSSWPFSDLLEQNAGNSSVESSLDEFEKFARGMPPGDAHDKPSGEAVRNIKISLKKKEDKARDNASGRDVNTDAKVVHEKRRGKEKDRADKDKVTNCKKESVGINIFGVDTLSNVNGPRSQLKVRSLKNRSAGFEFLTKIVLLKLLASCFRTLILMHYLMRSENLK